MIATENLMTMSKIFGLQKIEAKPRTKKQIRLKMSGDEAPWYHERMGLTELEDFLIVAAERIDYAKIATTQVLNHPQIGLIVKLNFIKKHSIQPYLDHGYLRAYRNGVVDEVIEAELGFSVYGVYEYICDVPEHQLRASGNEP